MARRRQRARKGRSAAVAAAKKRCEEGTDNNPNPANLASHLPQQRPRVDTAPSSAMEVVATGSKRSIAAHAVDNDSSGCIENNTRSKRMRRRGPLHDHQSCLPLLLPTTPLPLAVYQPASLFAMLLVASLLPKNTFSLKWLALSGEGFSGSIKRNVVKQCLVKSNNGCKLFANQSERIASSWLAMALDTESGCLPCDESTDADEGSKSWDRKMMLALWNEATLALEDTFIARGSAEVGQEDDEMADWSIDSVMDTIPRGGGLESDGKTYAGLVNLGNTCYLNAQLQCAYHVPYLRQLIKDAKDEVVEVEVEVEVEIEDEDGEEEKKEDNEEADTPAPECENAAEESIAETTESEMVPKLQVEEEKEEEVIEAPKPKMRTVMKKEMKEEIKPISYALQALKITFNSLTHAGTSSGSTNILCRTLGINPYLQQDGQEFWKLFIPEIDYDELAKLYSGYFEDYVREIVPESEDAEDEEEEKKEDGAEVPINNKARERVRTEPFLDLSIPVAEGTGGSVEDTLREMFTEPEILRVSEGNGWRPSKEADKVDAYKGSSLKRDGLPSLLQLHLKRFKYDWETGETSKINDCCSFPLELDLSDISEDDGKSTEDDALYDLQSIVIHKGEYGSGHYYSYVRPDIRQTKWFRFDDEFVTEVDYSDVVADAYGGNRRTRRKRSRSDSFEASQQPAKRRRGLFQRLLSLFGFFRRLPMIGSSSGGGGGFGYGGRASNAYMLQYARRSDIPKLYLEDK